MKPFLLAVGAILFLGAPALAVDHDNIDASRPLTFDDAETIAFGERAFEFGLRAIAPYRRNALGANLSLEYLYGFRVNTHFSVDVDPSFGARAGSGDNRADVGNIGFGLQHNFNRETLKTPAFGVRADAYLPTGRGSQGMGVRLRGILSRTIRQYDRYHVNVDANFVTSPGAGERSFVPAVTLGYSTPVGYPRNFNRTVVAELGTRASDNRDGGAIFNAGVGLRQQVTVRSVFDVGVQSDFAVTKFSPDRDNIRLVAGYSTQF